MNKIAIIEVKVGLPAGFKPRTVTYRAYSKTEKASEKAYVLKRAEELFVEYVLETGAEWKWEKSALKVKSSVTVRNVHYYVPAENQVKIEFSKNLNQ